MMGIGTIDILALLLYDDEFMYIHSSRHEKLEVNVLMMVLFWQNNLQILLT